MYVGEGESVYTGYYMRCLTCNQKVKNKSMVDKLYKLLLEREIQENKHKIILEYIRKHKPKQEG